MDKESRPGLMEHYSSGNGMTTRCQDRENSSIVTKMYMRVSLIRIGLMVLELMLSIITVRFIKDFGSMINHMVRATKAIWMDQFTMENLVMATEMVMAF